jgi:hypothetical protein
MKEKSWEKKKRFNFSTFSNKAMPSKIFSLISPEQVFFHPKKNGLPSSAFLI